MKLQLRFDIGEDHNTPQYTTTIEVDPNELTRAELILLADRLHWTDVQHLHNSDDGTAKVPGSRIVAKTPDLGGLFEAIRDEEKVNEERLQRHRELALNEAMISDDVKV